MEELCYNLTMKSETYIYKILSAFERQLDTPRFDMDEISSDVLKISEQRRNRYLEMLVNAGYISGIHVKELSDGTYSIQSPAPKITLKGIEYLAENAAIAKVVKALKKTTEIATTIIP